MIQGDPPEADEWQEWYRLSPLERWQESMNLWQQYLAQGGSLDPEPDSQSPFDFPELWGARPVDGRSGLRVLRRDLPADQSICSSQEFRKLDIFHEDLPLHGVGTRTTLSQVPWTACSV